MPLMRIAFVGKGGAGKSTIAGTFARLLARRDRAVLALDSDPMPGLPYSLGVAVDDHPIPDDVVVPGPAGRPRWVLRPDLDAPTFVDRYAVRGPDGVLYLQFGNLWGHVVRLQQAQHAWSQVVEHLDQHQWHLVGDLPGGTRQAMAGWAKYADTVCLVVEPTVKSLHTAKRLLALSDATWAPANMLLVVNKASDDSDAKRISERLELPAAAVIPEDREVARADRRGAAPLDTVPDGPLCATVNDLVSQVECLYARN